MERATADRNTQAFRSWVRGKGADGPSLTPEERDAVKAFRNSRGEFVLLLNREPPAETRAALSAQLGPSGGYLVSPGLVGAFEIALKFFSAVRQCASVIRTDKGEPYHIPQTDDTSNEGDVVPENGPLADGEAIDFTLKVLDTRKYTSGVIKVGQELIDDVPTLSDFLGRVLGERIGRRQNRDLTTGERGFLTFAPVGKTAAAATAIALDDLEDLVGSIDPAYRANGTFQMHADVLLALAKKKDDTGRPMYPEATGPAPKVLNFPVVTNLHMPTMSVAGAKTVAFGDFAKIVIRDVREVSMRTIMERYRSEDQTGFVSFLRSDGGLLDAGTHPIKVLQQAAS